MSFTNKDCPNDRAGMGTPAINNQANKNIENSAREAGQLVPKTAAFYNEMSLDMFIRLLKTGSQYL